MMSGDSEKGAKQSETIAISSDPPTVDVKSKKAEQKNSGSMLLNPPTCQMGAK